MKTPAILLLATSCLLLCDGLVDAANIKVISPENQVSRSLGNKIKEGLEKLKEQMKTGNPELGLPVLEPIDIEHQNINIQEEKFSLEGTIDDVHVQGLSDYTVQFADLKIAKWNLTIDLLWNSIKGNLTYDLDGLISNNIPLYGDGDVEFEVKGLRYATQAKLKLNREENKVSILELSNTIFSLDILQVNITGLFNDDELSELINAVISENAANIISDFQEEITAEVDKLVLQYGNEILEEISLDDILGALS